MEEGGGRPGSVVQHFGALKDPRIERTKRHDLLEILVIALCGVLCGADSWVEIEAFGHAKVAWLKQFLKLPNGIPSHDTFGRVFARLDPRAFQECFLNWIRSISDLTQGEVVAIDGKTLRRSFDRRAGKRALHLISAWACTNRLVLGQLKTDEHSNEITAIPHLLHLLDVAGCLVTIDAIGTQQSIAGDLMRAGADYVLALKANQATTFEEARLFLDEWAQAHQPHETVEKDHGRLEVRRAWLSEDLDWFSDKAAWAGLHSFGMVEASRTLPTGQTQRQRRYYLSSLKAQELSRFAQAVRAHWGIENAVHWVLDVTFREDHARVRKDHAPENFALIRRMALNLLKQDSSKGSLNVKRLRAACDHDYLAKVLFQI